MAATLESIDGRRPPMSEPYVPAPPGRWNRNSFAGYTPEDVYGILSSLRNGDYRGTETWADLASHMMRIDAHIKSTYGTLIHGIASSSLEGEPGRHSDEGLAQAGLEFVLDSIRTTPGVHGTYGNLLHAVGVGWGAVQHRWTFTDRVRGQWHSSPTMVQPWDLTFRRSDWALMVRSYLGDRQSWELVDNLHPASFITHVPGGIGETPNLSGLLLSVVWPWCFKKWIELWRQTSLERNATPWLYGVVAPNADDVVRDAMKKGLANFSGDQYAVFEALIDGQDPLRVLDSSGNAGVPHTDVIKHIDEQISKAILGSTLNTEVSSGGGNRSLGESQFDTTILPRLETYARGLADVLEHQWARWLLRFNAHVFGGRVPPTPQLRLQLVSDEAPRIDQIAVDAMAVDVDDIRRGLGLDPWGAERGGDRVVQPVAKTAPAFSSVAIMSDADGSGTADAPFPMTASTSTGARRTVAGRKTPSSRRSSQGTATTSQTSFRWPTRIGSVPFD